MQFLMTKAQIKAMLVLAATKDIRYYLNGIHVSQDQRGTIIEATDGHVLGMLRIGEAPNPPAKVILGRDALKPLTAGTKKQMDDIVEFSVDGGNVTASCGGMVTTFKAIDGVFPDVTRVIPLAKTLDSSPDAPAQINPALLVRFVDVSSALNGNHVWVRHRGDGTCLVSIERPEFVGVVMAMRGYEQFSVPDWVHAERVIEKNATDTVEA